ncbi:hypothetical protein BU15DRAFT_62009 [Melanogaster broomeanus]|nr:hypothetical protein BU15DRAFT_62009 [Melanogaster broomeanus]
MRSHNDNSPMCAMQQHTRSHDNNNVHPTSMHPSVLLTMDATSHDDDSLMCAMQQHTRLCHSQPVQQAMTTTTQRVRHSNTPICATHSPEPVRQATTTTTQRVRHSNTPIYATHSRCDRPRQQQHNVCDAATHGYTPICATHSRCDRPRQQQCNVYDTATHSSVPLTDQCDKSLT